MNTLILKTAAEVGSAISAIARSGKALDSKIQLVALSCLYHMREHGDTTLFTRLCVAMPKGSRVKTLLEWARAFAPIRSIDPKSFAVKLEKERTPADFKLEEADVSPWYEFKAAPKVQDAVEIEDVIAALGKFANPKPEGREVSPAAREFATRVLGYANEFRAEMAREKMLAEAAFLMWLSPSALRGNAGIRELVNAQAA